MSFKDYFSIQAQTYAKYRPHYPDKLFRYLAKISTSHNSALDLATGNGQAAVGLIPYFKHVLASDASVSQVSNAMQKNQICYFVSKSEEIPVANDSIDLIVCAQAVHWFNWEPFYIEVKRVLKKDGIITILGYGLPQIENKIDQIVLEFYSNIVHAYWPEERKHIEDKYENIPFPFSLINHPGFEIKLKWKYENLIGFLESWSATQNYIRKNNKNPVDFVKDKINEAWTAGKNQKNIDWSFFLKIGKLR